MLAIIALLALLLWVPFVCRFELAGGDGEETVKRIKLSWMFISTTIDTDAVPERKPSGEVKKRKKEKVKKERDLSRVFELFRTLYRPTIALVRRVVRSISIRELSCDLTFGLSDPADTGMLAGFLYAASATISRSHVISIRLDPVFWDQTFGYRARGSIGITLGRLIPPIILFGCSRPVRAEIVRYIRKH